MEGFGYQIMNTLVTDIAPDARVKQAMNEINAAQRARVAAQDRAEADKIMVVKAAEADAEKVSRRYRYGASATSHHRRFARIRRRFPRGCRRNHEQRCVGDDDDDSIFRYDEGCGHERRELDHLRASRPGASPSAGMHSDSNGLMQATVANPR